MTLKVRVQKLEAMLKTRPSLDIDWLDRRLDNVIDDLSPLEKDLLVLLKGDQIKQTFKVAFQEGQIPGPDVVFCSDPVFALGGWFLLTVFNQPISSEPLRWVEQREYDALAEILKSNNTIPPAWSHVDLVQLTLPEYLALRVIIAKAMTDPDPLDERVVTLGARLLYRTYRVTADDEEILRA